MWRQDIQYGIRALLKRPAFTGALVLILALGIGANTAMFSTINSILLRKLPFEDPARLVTVWETTPQKGIDKSTVSVPTFAQWQTNNSVFEQMAIYDVDTHVLTNVGEPERIPSAQVSPNFFSVLGVQTILGRTFAPDENQPGRDHVVMLSHSLWQRRFNSDQTIIGKTLVLSNVNYTVVGILPQDFHFIDQAELWSPLSLEDERQNCEACHFFTVIARLKKDRSLEQARAEMTVLAGRLQQQQQQEPKGVNVITLGDHLVAGVRRSLLILLATVTFVLLIACINVANLLLARTSERQKEFAVRAAMGATRLRLIRQILVESVIVALLGGVFGLALARWCMAVVSALIPQGVLHDRIILDLRVLGFTFVLSLLTGVVFGLLPAFKASNIEFNELLKDSTRGSTGGIQHAYLRRLTIISEVALSMLLLVNAGLMIKSFLILQRTSPGFNPDNLLTARVFLNTDDYPEAQQKAAFFHQALQQLETIPGVQSVAATTTLPLSGSSMNFRFSVDGQVANVSAEYAQAQYRAISSDYFRTMGIPLLEGREFTDRDEPNAPGVVVINETMARRVFPDGDAIGKRLTITYGKPTSREIVGIVGDVKHLRLNEDAKPEMYVPYSQNPWSFMTFVIRATIPPTDLVSIVRQRIWSINKNQPIDKILTMNQILYESIAQPRLSAFLLGLFAALAFLLSAVGIYGVMSYLVSQRTHEMGIRMALGARSVDIFTLVIKQGMSNVLLGIALGLILCLIVTRILSGLLYGISATDPVTLIQATLLLAGTALLACLIPARQATRFDPLTALRTE
jgi:putative ABC transport system permease protein